MRKKWNELYTKFTELNDKLVEYFEYAPQTASLKKVQKDVQKLMNENIKQLNDFDRYVSPVNPIKVLFPTDHESFLEKWNLWKEYLSEQHGILMRTRFEKESLKLLWDIADKDYNSAIYYLHFAMANGYPRFFKVNKNQKQQPKEIKDDNPFH